MKTTTDKRTEIKQKKKQVPESCEWEKQDGEQNKKTSTWILWKRETGWWWWSLIKEQKQNKRTSTWILWMRETRYWKNNAEERVPESCEWQKQVDDDDHW